MNIIYEMKGTIERRHIHDFENTNDKLSFLSEQLTNTNLNLWWLSIEVKKLKGEDTTEIEAYFNEIMKEHEDNK